MNNEMLPEKAENTTGEIVEAVEEYTSEHKVKRPAFSIRKTWKTGKLVVFLLMIIAVLGLILYIFILQSNHIKELEETYKKAFEEGRGQETIDISPEISVDKATIMEGLKICAELTTIKYEYADIGDYTQDKKLFDKITIPFTTDKVIYAYKGVISIGIRDFNKTVIDIDEENKVIKVYLPSIEILGHEILNDDFKTYDVKQSIFTEMGLDNYNEFTNALKKSQEKLIQEDEEFWKKAKTSTVETVKTILSIYDLPEGYSMDIAMN